MTALVTSLLAAVPASAFDPPPDGALATLSGSNFEIDTDANLTAEYYNSARSADYLDWNTVSETRGTDKATGQTDDSYKGGVKEDTECPEEVTGSIPNNKSDLLTFSTWRELGVGSHPGFLHLAWSRVSDPSGTTLMDFEFNQSTTACSTGPNKVRTEGDLLLEYSITQGGARASIQVRTWNATAKAWRDAAMLDPTKATGTINTSPIEAANSDGILSTGTMQARTFGEASIDLTAIFKPDKCSSFGSAMLKSRSSDSFTSQLKDFIAPQPITITNCGTVKITKQTLPDEDPAATEFSYTKAFNTDPSNGNTFALMDDGTKEFTGVLFGTGYTVEEGTLPAGWDFKSLDCSASLNVEPTIEGRTVTFDINSADDVLDCTYTNERQRGSILVQKVVKGTDPPVRLAGATFALDADGDVKTTGDRSPIAAVVGKDGLYCVDGLLFGDYYVVETAAPTGYTGETGAKKATVATESTCAGRTGETVDTPDLTFENIANPAIVTMATAAVTVGEPIEDVATLSGGHDPSGTITFRLYSDDECTTELFTDEVTVDGNGNYTSASYTTDAAVLYQWIASYSGDASNAPVSGKCGDDNEASAVLQDIPAIVTKASASVTVGESIKDVATLSAGYNPTGKITFRLYSDDTCSTEVFSDTVTVDGSGDYTSGPYATTAAGTYYWIASYSGDANNDSVSGTCGDANESSVVDKASPALATTPNLLPNDSAELTGGFGTLAGTLSFGLYGSADCTGEPLYEEDVDVAGSGTYVTTNTSVLIDADGTYSWKVSYTGDGNNKPAFSTCEAEQVRVDFTPLG